MNWRAIVLSLAPYDMLRLWPMRRRKGSPLWEKLAASALWRDLPPEIDAQVPPFRGGAAGLFRRFGAWIGNRISRR